MAKKGSVKKKEHRRDYNLQWNKKTSVLLGASVALLLLSITLCMLHVYRVLQAYRNFVDSSIVAQTELDAELVSANLDADIQIINSTAEQLQQNENYDMDDLQIYKLLLGVRNKSGLDRVVLVDRDGSVYSSDRYNKVDNLEQILSDAKDSVEPVVKKTYYDFGDGQASFTIVLPVIHKGINQGYLLGMNSSKKLLGGTERGTYNNISRSYVINEKGRIMASTNPDTKYVQTEDDFYTSLLNYLSPSVDPDLMEESLRKSFARKESGFLPFKSADDDRKIFFAPVEGVKNWTFVNIVSEDSVADLVRGLKVESIVTVFLIIILMLLLSIMIGRFVLDEQRQMLRLAFEDSLTQAPNERYFSVQTGKLLKDYSEISYRIVSFDVQNFRYLNESYGHMKADDLLRIIVKNVEKELSTRETYARIGADRFVALIVDDGRTDERIQHLEERIAKAAGEENINYPIKLKCGFYEVVDRKENVAAMIDKANLARKSVPAQGKNLMAVYEDSLMEETRRRELIESKMEMALISGEFVPYLQPKWDMRTNEIVAAEALVRWKQNKGELIPPNDFISIFENNGFIERVDFYMLEEICKYIRQMIDEGRKVYPVSINQSRYLLHDPSYTMNVQKILLKYKIPKSLIELELTETVFFQERDRMLDVMEELKRMNIDLSIDDFGSGFSSLNLLRDMPCDVLKIDRGFLNETNASESGKFILQKIVEMADGLGVKVICEGVETREQVEMLLDIGCYFAQGYLFSRPIPLDEFIEKYNEKMNAEQNA
ncbi:MAG: GGDEF domain-containing protein [Lachnospiraceae bacterium]|nr:GGDEF domain-containing protein [Lachnospiraceae bacterium]